MKYFKEINDLPILPLYEEFSKLMNEGKIQWDKSRQICINGVSGKTDDIYHGTGSLIYDWKSLPDLKSDSITVPERAVHLKEEDFTEICDVFRGTVFEELYKILLKKYNIGRVILMQSTTKTCLTWHVDPTPRLHFPMKTQEGCFMVIENEILHLSKNQWYYTNTTVPHTAFNGSKESRLHLVVVLC